MASLQGARLYGKESRIVINPYTKEMRYSSNACKINTRDGMVFILFNDYVKIHGNGFIRRLRFAFFEFKSYSVQINFFITRRTRVKISALLKINWDKTNIFPDI